MTYIRQTNGDFLDWNTVTGRALEAYCARVGHETVGDNLMCRCGAKSFEPWEMPQNDRVYTFKPDPVASGAVFVP